METVRSILLYNRIGDLLASYSDSLIPAVGDEVVVAGTAYKIVGRCIYASLMRVELVVD